MSSMAVVRVRPRSTSGRPVHRPSRAGPFVGRLARVDPRGRGRRGRRPGRSCGCGRTGPSGRRGRTRGRAGRGHPAGRRGVLDVAGGVVRGVADRAAGETGQLGEVDRPIGGEQRLQVAERVGGLEPAGGAGVVGPGDRDLPAPGLEPDERLGAEQAVSADLLAADDRLEEERGGRPLDPTEGRDRGQAVGDELAIDGDAAGPRRPVGRTRRRRAGAGPCREPRDGRWRRGRGAAGAILPAPGRAGQGGPVGRSGP